MATVGLAWSTTLSTCKPFGNVRSRKFNRGIVVCPAAVTTLPKNTTQMTMLNKNLRISFSRLPPSAFCLMSNAFCSSIHIQWVPVNLVLVLFGALHCFPELLFQQAPPVLHRTHFLGEDLFSRLFCLVEVPGHVFKRCQRLLLLLVRNDCTSHGVYDHRCLAAGTDDGKFVCARHIAFYTPARRLFTISAD